MKIARLALSAFGPFTDTALDFTGAPEALQLVYGSNEAGKSTTLRALTALFYGVPVRTGDAHLHEMTRLRVGATLLDADGNAVTVTRRKGAKHTLLGAADEPIDEAGLTRLLGGLDETLFRQMFGLDHEHLRAGGEALLAGQGQLGETLFSAATGARGVSQVIADLRAQLEGLYKPRGKQPKLNQALERLHACERRIKEATLSPQSYLDQQRALEEARAGRDRAQASRRALLAEQSQLRRRLAILPVLRRREELLREPAPVVARETDDGALAALLRELERRHGSVLAAAEAGPAQRAERALLERDVSELRARLGSAAAAAGALETPVRARLRKLADEARALADEQRELTRAVAETDASEAARGAPADAPPPLSEAQRGQLAERIELAERAGLGGLAQQAAELARRAALIVRGAAQLGVPGDPAALSRLALPDDAQLAGLESLLVRTQRAAERLAEGEARHASETAELAQQRAALLAAGALPSASDLADARALRDQQLAQLAVDARAGRAPALEQVVALERAVARADAVADQLRREARRAAEFHQLEGRGAALVVRSEQLARDAEALAALRTTLAHEARRLLAPLGLAHVGPERARAALTRLSALVGQATEHEALSARWQRERARAAELARELREACGGEAEASDDDDDVLERALVRARRQLARADDALRTEAARRQHREEQAARRARARAALGELAAREAAFRARYAAELRTLGFDAALAPDEVLACLDDLAALAQKTRELSGLLQRLEAQAQERDALADEVQRALARFAPDWAPVDGSAATPEAALAELSRRQREQLAAQRDAARRESELVRLDAQLAELGDGASIAQLTALLADFEPHAARARLGELDDLLEQASEQLGDLEQTVGRLEGGLELLHQTAGASASAEELESELARARALAREYYETRLALSVLQREVERYRREHQGPLLARAGALFPRLTLGRYTGLAVEYDERDQPVLACVRHDDKCVRVSALSDGTRDQLYFALRVASIERFVARGAVLPLILDDAFVHFDDERARAALEVLGELCAHTQVIFFTHHARMVELSLRALGRERVALHQLPRVAGVIARPDDGPLFA